MDYKTLRLTILAVLSVSALAVAMVFYVNRKEHTAHKAVSENMANTTAEKDQQSYYAFLEDETFFDEEPNAGNITVSGNTLPSLYMMATSVQHDIRIMITDDTGNIVTGESFYIEIDDNEYKDIDKDGLISIPDLDAGEYYVSLKPVSGYNTPKEPMAVTVKEQLEYAVIDDISYYIHTEDEIDALSEDTGANIGIGNEDIDATENTSVMEVTEASLGIDVSKWQKSIDWDKVKATGVEFAIIRCGYRGSSTGCLVEDPYFEENIKAAKAAGLDVGIYFFSQATNEVEAVEEASMCISLLGDNSLDYPVFIDSESAGGRGRADGLDAATRTACCEAFCKTIEASGYNAGIYASRNWFDNNLDMTILAPYKVWDAEYRNAPIYTGHYDIWQYTSGGHIDGITTRVDLNLGYYK